MKLFQYETQDVFSFNILFCWKQVYICVFVDMCAGSLKSSGLLELELKEAVNNLT